MNLMIELLNIIRLMSYLKTRVIELIIFILRSYINYKKNKIIKFDMIIDPTKEYDN